MTQEERDALDAEIDTRTGELVSKQDTVVDAPQNPFANVVQRQGTGAMVDVAASREVADVQAAMLVAHRFPRDPIHAMDRILMAFTRPTLAETALYSYSRGGSDVTGLSIRAAEAMAQEWGHIHMAVEEIDRREGDVKNRVVGVSTVRAWCFDAQTGTRDSKTFQVKHWRDTKKGGYQITDERDIYELIANMAARRKRACILAVIPGDVQDAVQRQIETTLRAKVQITSELLTSLAEKFGKYGVTVPMIEKRIQRRMEAITPGLVVQLGKIFNSLSDGMSVPRDWFEIDEPPPDDGDREVNKGGGAEALKVKLGGRKATAKDADKNATAGATTAKPGDPAGGSKALNTKDNPPSYAEVMNQINKAESGDLVALWGSMTKHLPADQRVEIERRANERLAEFNKGK